MSKPFLSLDGKTIHFPIYGPTCSLAEMQKLIKQGKRIKIDMRGSWTQTAKYRRVWDVRKAVPDLMKPKMEVLISTKAGKVWKAVYR